MYKWEREGKIQEASWEKARVESRKVGHSGYFYSCELLPIKSSSEVLQYSLPFV
jgi:hypothetical protein